MKKTKSREPEPELVKRFQETHHTDPNVAKLLAGLFSEMREAPLSAEELARSEKRDGSQGEGEA